jgi:hypothetical protein
MALLKPLDQGGTGHVCAYWRVTRAEVDHAAGTVTGYLSGYRDESARREGLNPLLVNKRAWTAADLGVPCLHDLTTGDLYQGFLQDPVFQDAATDEPAPPPLPFRVPGGAA